MPRMTGYKEVTCRTCGELIKRFRRSAYPRGHVPKSLILKAIRRHYKEAHPRKFKEFAKKAVKTKKARGILDASLYVLEEYAPEPKIKARRKLISKPKVIGFEDFDGDGLIRVLERTKDFFPEFAFYMKAWLPMLERSLKHARFKEEERGKWVLRTNKFSIFVYT